MWAHCSVSGEQNKVIGPYLRGGGKCNSLKKRRECPGAKGTCVLATSGKGGTKSILERGNTPGRA